MPSERENLKMCEINRAFSEKNQGPSPFRNRNILKIQRKLGDCQTDRMSNGKKMKKKS
jgi:hypothetical protein